MIKRILSPFCAIILLLLVFGCKKYPHAIPEGVYTGTFTKQFTLTGDIEFVSSVSITFAGDTWTGQCENWWCSINCHGTYKIEKQNITFFNGCCGGSLWGEADMLTGIFKLNLKDKKLNFVQHVSPAAASDYDNIYNINRQ